MVLLAFSMLSQPPDCSCQNIISCLSRNNTVWSLLKCKHTSSTGYHEQFPYGRELYLGIFIATLIGPILSSGKQLATLAMIVIGRRKERKKKELPNVPTSELCFFLIGNCVHFLPPLSLPTADLARVWSGVGEGQISDRVTTDHSIVKQ